MKIGSIDLSMNGPAITTFDENVGIFNFLNCKKYYLNIKKYSYDSLALNIFGDELPEYKSNEERWNKISDWVYNCIKHCDIVSIEGYSYGSKSQTLFQIGELCGVVKQKLYLNDIDIISIPPTVIKKFATTKGNANKELLNQYFIKETNINLKEIFKQTEKQWNPSSDIIDSYYQCKYLLLNKDNT